MKDNRIAYFCKAYLPLSQTFIYDILKNISTFDVIILAQELTNLSSFPYPQEKLFIKSGALRWRYFRNILLKNKPQLVNAHWGRYGILISPLCKKLNLPLVTTFYGVDVYRYTQQRLYLHKLKRLFQQGDGFITCSQKMKRDIISLGCPANKVFVNYHGVDVERFPFVERRKKNRFDILLYGRFVEKKGLEYGIEAFSIIARKYKQAFLTIIGDGRLRKKLEKMVKVLSIEDKVRFLGFLPHSQVPEIMREMDILLSPNVTAHNGDQEGIPTTIKEAMAMGLPVISSYHSGIPELVIDGETGFLAPEKDVSTLTKKLEHLIEEPTLREKFGRKGREIILERFNLLKQVKELEKIYQTIIS